MTGRQAFELWAPAGARWTEWARPVPFVGMDSAAPSPWAARPIVPSIAYLQQLPECTGVLIDLPGGDAVAEGIAFARLGFRPVPLYNGTDGQAGAMALVDSHAVAAALHWGALQLREIALLPDAPPAFLLDSSRTHRHKMDASLFDNSWDIYPQDMPSAAYFLTHGIRNIIVRGEGVQRDLRKVLYPFQQEGGVILLTDGCAPPKKVKIRRPWGGTT